VSAGDLADEVRRLERMKLEELREEWRRRFGPPPALRSPELLALMLGWRIQAERTGGLDAELRRMLRRPPSRRTPADPGPGTRLVREWEGVPHEVIAMSGGKYLYRGQEHQSLSQIARLITGVRWNGPRFFGLRQDASAA
jgi:hypothetical protein